MALHVLYMQPTVGDAAIDYSAQEFRQMARAHLAVATAGVTGTQGIITSAAYQVTQRGAGANLSVDVAGGHGYVLGDDVSNQGTYLAWNDATVNVPGITVPGAGTFHHRIVLQIQDKLNNGAWSGYTAAVTALLDSGGGLPAEPNSALTLATIDVPTGSGSIINSMINDYRPLLGTVAAAKGSNEGRTSTTTLADDASLQLLNLQPNARYAYTGSLFYNGADQTGGANGGLKFNHRTGTGLGGKYAAIRINPSNLFAGAFVDTMSTTETAQSQGTGQDMAVTIQGEFVAGGTPPQFVVLQWAQNSSSGTATTLEGGSWLQAERIT